MVDRINLNGESKRPAMLNGVNAEGSLWVLLPKAAASIMFSSLLLLAAFWLHEGELDAFAYGITGFLVLLQVLLIIGVRFSNRTDVQVNKPGKGDITDKIGGFWLIACAFGAFIGLICGRTLTFWPVSWQLLSLATVLFSIVLPVITMLPNLRYLQARAAALQVPLIVFVTGLPILLGISALVTLINHAKP